MTSAGASFVAAADAASELVTEMGSAAFWRDSIPTWSGVRFHQIRPAAIATKLIDAAIRGTHLRQRFAVSSCGGGRYGCARGTAAAMRAVFTSGAAKFARQFGQTPAEPRLNDPIKSCRHCGQSNFIAIVGHLAGRETILRQLRF
jgi:hypothetical protein